MTDTQEQSKEIQAFTNLGDDVLRSITSWDDAYLVLAEEFSGEIYSSADLGNGFTPIKDKDQLVGVPMIFLQWKFHSGDFGEFVSTYALAKYPNGTMGKYVINDGSTGIYAMLREFTDRTGRNGGMTSARGLRKSEYEYADENGDVRKAHTFYIDTTPGPTN